MGGFFSGLAGSLGNKLHEMHVENLNNQITTKRNLLDNYQVLLQDPHLADVHGDIIGALMKAAGTDPTKLHKQITKPGGEFDPTQWQVLAQQRAAGQAPSPVNQGQNGSQIPAAPIQHNGTPGGGAQTAPPWNTATSDMDTSLNQQLAQSHPGSGGAGGYGPVAPQDQSMIPDSIRELLGIGPPPQQAAAVSNLSSNATQSLPSTGPAPSGGAVASPQAAAASAAPMAAPAMIPPPPHVVNYGPAGSISDAEIAYRDRNKKAGIAEDQQQAEMHRMNQVEAFKRQQAKQEHAEHVAGLKAEINPATGKSVWDEMTPRERSEVSTGEKLSAAPRALPTLHHVFGSDAPPGQLDFANHPIDPAGVYDIRPNPATGELEWHVAAVSQRLQTGMDPNDPTGQTQALFAVNPYNPTAVSPVAVPGIKKLNMGMLGSQRSVDSTTDSSGHTKGTTVTQKVLSNGVNGVGTPPPVTAAARANSPAGAGGGAGGGRAPARLPGSGGGAGAGGERPEIQRWAEDKVAGRNPTIPAKDQPAVTRYMVSHGMESPTPLSAKGASDLAALDPVLAQVQDLMQQLRAENLHNNNDIKTFVPDYAKYRVGLSTPRSDFFTDVSFEKMRSAAAALKGSNARAYPILRQAFDHTPNLDRLGGFDPDSPKAIYGKLATMEKILRQGRNTILADEKKSGIPGSSSDIGAPPANTSPQNNDGLPAGWTVKIK